MNTTNCPHCGGSLAILKATDPPEQKKPTEPKSELKLVKCNRCGEENLCWQESKNGKFYLCRTRTDGGRVIPLRKEFHVCRT